MLPLSAGSGPPQNRIKLPEATRTCRYCARARSTYPAMICIGEIGPWSTCVIELCRFDAQARQRIDPSPYGIGSLSTAKALAGAIAAAELRRERAGPRAALFAQPSL
jgi:hypothetical protein